MPDQKRGGQRWLHAIEQPTAPYALSGETALALAILPLGFVFQALRSVYAKGAAPSPDWAYVAVLSLFTALAFSSVFFLATPPGERLVRRLLADRRRTAWLCAAPVLFVGLYLLVLWIFGFPGLYTEALKKISAPWSRLPLPVFLALAGALLYAGFRGALALAMRCAARTPGPLFFGWRQFGCVLLGALPYLVLQEQLPLLWCFSTPVALVVLVYGTGLGREYFGFTLVPRSRREALFAVALLAAGLLLFLAVNFLAGGITYTGGLWRSPWWRVYTSSFMFLFVVGISEEVIFRCGVLTLFASLLSRSGGRRWWSRYPRTGAAVATSLLFAVAHFPFGPLFMFLAFLASLLYGLAFVAGKSLFGPVLLHGLLNVLLLMNFRLMGM